MMSGTVPQNRSIQTYPSAAQLRGPGRPALSSFSARGRRWESHFHSRRRRNQILNRYRKLRMPSYCLLGVNLEEQAAVCDLGVETCSFRLLLEMGYLWQRLDLWCFRSPAEKLQMVGRSMAGQACATVSLCHCSARPRRPWARRPAMAERLVYL